jgi:hypothetical protein
MKLDREHAKFIPFLSSSFNQAVNEFKKVITDVMARAVASPKGNDDEVKESLRVHMRELEKVVQPVQNAARLAMGTKALTTGNEALFALHEIDPSNTTVKKLMKLLIEAGQAVVVPGVR